MNDPSDREVLVFNAALELPANERNGYLSETCRDDIELHHRVAALLEAHMKPFSNRKNFHGREAGSRGGQCSPRWCSHSGSDTQQRGAT